MGRFSIDADPDTPQPHNMVHPERPEVGAYMNGMPIKQGFPGLEVTYDVLTYAKMAKLRSLYNASDPRVQVTYDDPDSPTGESVTEDAWMHEPKIGARETLYYRNVTVLFTGLEAP